IPLSPGATIDPNPGVARDYTSPVTYTITKADNSRQSVTITVVVQAGVKSSEKQITAFSFTALNPSVQATIDQTTRKITATVPATVNIASLVPTITLSAKATSSPASGVEQNFTKPVIFTVKAEDGSTQTYEVTVVRGNVVDVNTSIVYVNGYAFDALTGNPLWFVNIGSLISDNYSPAIYNNTIYTSGGGSSFYALNLYTGSTKWEFRLSGTNGLSGFASPIIIGNLVYVSANVSYSGRPGGTIVYALDLTTGAKKWEFADNNSNSGVLQLVGESAAIYACIGSKIFALDADSGAKKWEVDIPPFAYLGPQNIKPGSVSANPCIFNKTLYFSNASSYLYRIDLTKTPAAIGEAKQVDLGTDNGAPTTNANTLYYSGTKGTRVLRLPDLTELGELIKGGGNPTVVDGILYSTQRSNYLFAFDAVSGATKWEFRAGDYSKLGNPVAGDGVVYVSDAGTGGAGKLYALDAKTGQKKWEQPM
ncbi:MAG: DUF5018 domain-containing protein, partial [Cytophagaceae bacterium]